MRNLRSIGLGVIVSVVCLYFVLRGVNWAAVWQHLQDVNLGMFGLSMLLLLAAYFLMAWRWQYLLDPLEIPILDESVAGRPVPGPATVRQRETLPSLYGKMLAGYFFNAFFPARAGDVIRAYLLSRNTGLRKTTVLATIVIEKAFDGLALLLMLLLSLILLPTVIRPDSSILDPGLLAWVAGAGLVAAVLGLFLFYRFSDRLARLADRVFTVLPVPDRLRRIAVRLIETFAGGMHVFKNPRPLIASALISILVWLTAALMLLAALLSFKTPFPPEITGPVGLLFMTAIVNLGLLVPALPGNLGTYEALCIAVMAFFRVDKDLAVAFALIFHVGQLVTTLIAGLVAFWAQNLKISEIRPAEAAAGNPGPDATLDEAEQPV